MNSARVFAIVFLLSVVAISARPIEAQAPAAGANTDPQVIWNALARPAFDPTKIASVSNLVIERDRIHITLTSGTLHFTQPVNGVVLGAVFHGSGQLQMTAPNPREAQQLHLFVKESGDTVKLAFDDAVFSFTDKTFDEISAKVSWGGATAPGDNLYAARIRQNEDVGAAFLPRMFKSVMATDRSKSALFLADMKTSDHGWVEAMYDASEPEEISLGKWAEAGISMIFDNWMSFPAGGRDAGAAFNVPFEKADFVIQQFDIAVDVTSSAEMTATAKVEIGTKWPGERVLLFGLDSNLRVDRVSDTKDKQLVFFEAPERKDRRQSYGDYVAVVLPNSTQPGGSETFTFHYAGKRVVVQVGGGNYFAESFGWYPTRIGAHIPGGDFEGKYKFHLQFGCPKNYVLVATGNKVGDTIEGNRRITEWKSDLPLAVGGFAFGDYKVFTSKVGDIEIQVYANQSQDDLLKQIQGFGGMRGAVGIPSALALAPQIGDEMGNAMRTFQKYFGAYPYKQLAITNIPGGYGQGWPGLIYLSIFTFLDQTQLNALGIRNDPRLTEFFRSHETSHQWWGHRVGWKSYHDQWLSEGFATFSGNLYTQLRDGQKKYIQRLKDDRQGLLAKDLHNRVIDSVGPAWMGYRTATSLGPADTSTIIYNKGGYALTMLRMMMADPTKPIIDAQDTRFIAMMHDFTQTFDNKAASTEDFKAIAEKYMTPTMDLDGDHKLDWFFNQYVYGTGIPHYEFHYDVKDAGGGKWNIAGTIKRTGVPDDWKDLIPLFMERGGQMVRLGLISATKPDTPVSFTLPNGPGKLQININEELLAEIKQ